MFLHDHHLWIFILHSTLCTVATTLITKTMICLCFILTITTCWCSGNDKLFSAWDFWDWSELTVGSWEKEYCLKKVVICSHTPIQLLFNLVIFMFFEFYLYWERLLIFRLYKNDIPSQHRGAPPHRWRYQDHRDSGLKRLPHTRGSTPGSTAGSILAINSVCSPVNNHSDRGWAGANITLATYAENPWRLTKTWMILFLHHLLRVQLLNLLPLRPTWKWGPPWRCRSASSPVQLSRIPFTPTGRRRGGRGGRGEGRGGRGGRGGIPARGSSWSERTTIPVPSSHSLPTKQSVFFKTTIFTTRESLIYLV